MKSKGIRIADKGEDRACVGLPCNLEKIQGGKDFYWSILYIYAIGDLGGGQSLVSFEKEVNKSERGLFISWNELSRISKKFWQIYDIIILGCKDEKLLRRYSEDQEMCETCDIFIEMIDCGYWEVFSKDASLIDRLSKKFKEIEFLEPDFER